MVDVFSRISFCGKRAGWKPIQTGVLLSTKSLLDLFATLVKTQRFTFLLTGRFTQDSLENLFSQLRGFGDSHPAPVHLRHNLRLLCLAQFMQIPKHSSYEPDDDVYLLNFIKCRTKNGSEPYNVNDESERSLNVSGLVDVANCIEIDYSIDNVQNENDVNAINVDSIPVVLSENVLNCNETNALFVVSGWVCFKLKTKITCSICTSALTST